MAALIGFIAAFLSSMPVAGPIAALVVTRSIGGRYRSAFMLAIGSGLAESCYAFLALYGFASFVVEYPVIRPVSKALAAVILLVLGYFFTRHKSPDPSEQRGRPPRDTAWGSFLLGLSITAMNPTLIVTWSGFAPMLDATGIVDLTPSMALPFAFGVCTGTIAWFAFLVGVIRRYKDRFQQETLDRVIQWMGWALIGLGLYFTYNFVVYLVDSPVPASG